jgi:GT2 family glycosyltransferase
MAVAGRVFQPDDAPFSERVLPWYDQGDEPKQTHLVAGCNMAMRRGLFEEIGTFNEDLPWGHEEAELAERICKSHTIHYEPSMVVDHYFAESIWAYWKKSYRHGQADVQLWAVEGTPWRRRLSLSLPLIIPREDAVEAVSRMSKRFGRIKALVFGR